VELGIYRSADYWWKRAKRARQSAESMADPEAKHAMLTVAENCEQVARRAEAREQGREFIDRTAPRKRAFN
jgi:hypothetical protein